jgi:hypothetical protein
MFTTVEAFDEATTSFRVDSRLASPSEISAKQKGLWFIFHEYSLVSPHLSPACEVRKIGDGRQGSPVTFSEAH